MLKYSYLSPCDFSLPSSSQVMQQHSPTYINHVFQSEVGSPELRYHVSLQSAF